MTSLLDWPEWRTDPGRALGHAGVNVAGLFVGGRIATRLGRAAEAPAPAIETFRPPPVHWNRHGELTNGTWTIKARDMKPHLTGSLAKGKSQFLLNVDANKAVLDAATFADKHHLWVKTQRRSA